MVVCLDVYIYVWFVGRLSEALSACGKALLCDVALRLLRGCSSMALEPTLVTFNAAIDAAEKSAEWQEALGLFDEARRSRA